eukprot:m.144396 g.144396  ORF g.144396 m.144396 type:complete len:844 (+) comp14127_c0_seq1:155-2686(+)
MAGLSPSDALQSDMLAMLSEAFASPMSIQSNTTQTKIQSPTPFNASSTKQARDEASCKLDGSMVGLLPSRETEQTSILESPTTRPIARTALDSSTGTNSSFSTADESLSQPSTPRNASVQETQSQSRMSSTHKAVHSSTMSPYLDESLRTPTHTPLPTNSPPPSVRIFRGNARQCTAAPSTAKQRFPLSPLSINQRLTVIQPKQQQPHGHNQLLQQQQRQQATPSLISPAQHAVARGLAKNVSSPLGKVVTSTPVAHIAAEAGLSSPLPTSMQTMQPSASPVVMVDVDEMMSQPPTPHRQSTDTPTSIASPKEAPASNTELQRRFTSVSTVATNLIERLRSRTSKFGKTGLTQLRMRLEEADGEIEQVKAERDAYRDRATEADKAKRELQSTVSLLKDEIRTMQQALERQKQAKEHEMAALRSDWESDKHHMSSLVDMLERVSAQQQEEISSLAQTMANLAPVPASSDPTCLHAEASPCPSPTHPNLSQRVLLSQSMGHMNLSRDDTAASQLSLNSSILLSDQVSQIKKLTKEAHKLRKELKGKERAFAFERDSLLDNASALRRELCAEVTQRQAAEETIKDLQETLQKLQSEHEAMDARALQVYREREMELLSLVNAMEEELVTTTNEAEATRKELLLSLSMKDEVIRKLESQRRSLKKQLQTLPPSEAGPPASSATRQCSHKSGSVKSRTSDTSQAHQSAADSSRDAHGHIQMHAPPRSRPDVPAPLRVNPVSATASKSMIPSHVETMPMTSMASFIESLDVNDASQEQEHEEIDEANTWATASPSRPRDPQGRRVPQDADAHLHDTTQQSVDVDGSRLDTTQQGKRRSKWRLFKRKKQTL